MKHSIEGWQRSHHLGELTAKHEQETVILMGWVSSRRDHGNLVFVDLRDREGITQLVMDPTVSLDAHAIGEVLRNEFVLAVKGRVRKRPEGMINPKMTTGEIEVLVEEARLLNTSEPLPFQIQDNIEATRGLAEVPISRSKTSHLKDKMLTRIAFVREMRRVEAKVF